MRPPLGGAMSLARRLATLLAAVLLPLAGLVFIASSSSAATPAPRTCSPSQVTVSASVPQSSYSPGVPVTVTFSLHNHSLRTCSFTTGPFSPSFTLSNSSGTTVWASCWYGGGPAPCAFYLVH